MNKKPALLAALLLPPALLINLGEVIFIDDEAIRALVAQEMLWSGEFASPTLHGDVYLNKPPLFNWILAVFFSIFGTSEFVARLPTVLSVIGLGGVVYYFSQKHFPRWLAFTHALTAITCGRMLFWDSMLALIDVTFSVVVYAQIMVLYEHGRRGRWWWAFGLSYLLTAVGFMLKGLPAIVFQGITVFTLLFWLRSWRQFLRPAHLLSGIGCLLILGSYYWWYSGYVDLTAVFTRLFEESTKRTAGEHPWWHTLAHVGSFPFEMSYHFLPWTLLLVYLFQPGAWRALRQNDFAAFSLVVFLSNIAVYWLSPGVFPRYLLMLFPLLFGGLLYLHSLHLRPRTKTYSGLRYLLLGAGTLAAIIIPFAPLVPQTSIVDNAWLKSVFLGGAAGAMMWTAWRQPQGWLLTFAVYLLLLRVAFNVFVLPPRAMEDERGNRLVASATQLAQELEDQPLAVYGYSMMEPAPGFYLSHARGEIVPRAFVGMDTLTYYVVDEWTYPTEGLRVTNGLYLRHRKVVHPVGRFSTVRPDSLGRPAVLFDGMGTGLSLLRFR